jgi:hypothetical protein
MSALRRRANALAGSAAALHNTSLPMMMSLTSTQILQGWFQLFMLMLVFEHHYSMLQGLTDLWALVTQSLLLSFCCNNCSQSRLCLLKGAVVHLVYQS